MSERRPIYNSSAGKIGLTSNLHDFVDYVERQVKGMEQYGWKEVHGLRQWISELRKKVSREEALSE